MDLDARLCIEIVDDIEGKRIDLLSVSLVVEKLLERLWDEEPTLKSLVSSLIPCLLLHSVLKADILL